MTPPCLPLPNETWLSFTETLRDSVLGSTDPPVYEGMDLLGV